MDIKIIVTAKKSNSISDCCDPFCSHIVGDYCEVYGKKLMRHKHERHLRERCINCKVNEVKKKSE
ncbi:MAG: hypothetical protein ABIH09_00280 [Candidatus Omnitrophota bacterium]